MPVPTLSAGDVGASARDKINSAIALLNTTALGLDRKAPANDLVALAGQVAAERFAFTTALTRPGEAGAAFTLVSAAAELAGTNAMLPLVPPQNLTFGDNGDVVRTLQPVVIGMRRRIALEPERLYRLRAVVQRRANSADPSNDTVRVGIAYFDQAGLFIAAIPVHDYTALVTTNGRTLVMVGLARAAGTGVDVVAPANARHARAYVQSYASTGLVDVEILDIADVSDATLLPAISTDAVARITALESGNLAPRLTALESAVSGPVSLTFGTVSDAAAATIPVSITTVRVLGGAAAGDGKDAIFIRASGADHVWFTSADGAAWKRVISSISGVFNVREFGALGDGVADDTGAIQAAITAATLLGWAVFIPAGSYKTNAALTATGRVMIYGVGAQSDRGFRYAAEYDFSVRPSQSTGFTGSVIIPGDHDALHVATNDAILLRDFEVRYPNRPSAGRIGIDISGAAGGVSTGLIMDNVFVSGADTNVRIVDCLDFMLHRCVLREACKRNLDLDQVAYPSYGDASITGCTFWAFDTVDFSEHLLLRATGGAKISGNKFNYGANNPNGAAIRIKPDHVGSYQIEPLIITHNSMEGMQYGVAFSKQAGGGQCSQVVIAGNQIWIGKRAITIDSCPTDGETQGRWVNGLLIAANYLQVANTDADYVIYCGGVDGCYILGNGLTATTNPNAYGVGVDAYAAGVVQKSNGGNVRLAYVTERPVPASGVQVTNSYACAVVVYVFLPATSYLAVNARVIGAGTAFNALVPVTLNPGDTIAWGGGLAPTWTWFPVVQ